MAKPIKQDAVSVTAHDIAKAWLLWFGYHDATYNMAWNAFCTFLECNPYSARFAPTFESYMLSTEAAKKIAILCGPHANTILKVWDVQQEG